MTKKCLQAVWVEQSIKYSMHDIYFFMFRLQAPVLTMCGSSAEARVPGTPPDPSCPLIWARRAVPPYASLTVSCSVCSSIRDSSGSGFNPHKQPRSSPLALCHSSFVCWFGGGCRGLWHHTGNSRGLVIMWESLNELSCFLCLMSFLRGWIYIFFGSFLHDSQSQEMLLHKMRPADYFHALYE